MTIRCLGRSTAALALVVCTTVAAVTVAAQAQAPARDSRNNDVVVAGTSSIAGVIVDQDRQPVRRASVSLGGNAQPARTVVTDDGGRFLFAAIPAGRYTITVKKPGYPQMSYGARAAFRTGSGVVVAEGQALAGLSMTLARGAVIEGTVYDEQGQPAPGVPVQAWELRTALGGERTVASPRLDDDQRTTTDDRGRYRIYGLPPGEYTIGTSWFFHGDGMRIPTDQEVRAAFAAASSSAAASRPPGGSAIGGAPAPPAPTPTSLAYSPVYHPDTTDPLLARTFALAAGEERTGVDLRMQLRPMSRIEATIVDPAGQAVNGQVTLQQPGRNAGSTVSFISNGQYRSPTLAQGEYGLVVFVDACASCQPVRDVAVFAAMRVSVLNAEPVKLNITLQPVTPVTGHVVFERTSLAQPDLKTVRVNLSAAPGAVANFNGVRSTSDDRGVFTIVGITPARYRLSATVPGQASTGATWTVRSVLVDGRDVTDLPFEIAAGAQPSITVTFSDRTSELSGRLTQPSGQPAPDYFVVAIPADKQYWLPQSRRIVSVRPDINGRYTFRGLPAGDYRIALTTELDQQDLSDAAALERLFNASAPVTIGPGEQKTFDIRVGG